MKRWNRHIERWLLGSMQMLLLMISMLMLAACADDSDNDNGSGSGIDEPQTNQLRLSSATREGETAAPDYLSEGNIKVYVTSKDAVAFEGSFSKNSSDALWNSTNLKIKEDTQYYLYGYMPNTVSGEIAKPDGADYSDGATLTLTGLPVFSDEDFRVIVGVQRVTDIADLTAATEGTFSYLSGPSSQNYVNLLMGHVYSQLILQFNVDETYNALRHIKLKTVKLTSTYDEKVDATIKLQAGKSLDANSVAYSKNTDAGSGSSKDLEILKNTEAEKSLTTTAADVSFGPFNCAPSTFDADGSNLTLTCTYDVYDTEGNKVRENCSVTNKVKVTGMAPGVKKILTLTVTPTYLYVLSDDDLNNPTIKVN